MLLPAEVSKRGEEDLKGGETLLTVDDLPLLDVRDGHLLRVQHHRAQEVDGRVLAAAKVLGELALDVLPEWRPMLLLLPHVLPLKDGDLEPHFSLEDAQHRYGVCLHSRGARVGVGEEWVVGARRPSETAHRLDLDRLLALAGAINDVLR